jgi:hypothetical protein
MEVPWRSPTGSRLPFIWFWPDGASAAAMMTMTSKDAGLDFCQELSEIDGRTARRRFNLPEGHGRLAEDGHTGRARGFEVNGTT